MKIEWSTGEYRSQAYMLDIDDLDLEDLTDIEREKLIDSLVEEDFYNKVGLEWRTINEN